MHFCLASAASADSSILDEGKGGGNLDPDARTIVNDRGALSRRSSSSRLKQSKPYRTKLESAKAEINNKAKIKAPP